MLEGLPPNDATHVMRLAAGRETAQRVADLISETFDPAEVAVANFEAPTGEWVVEVFAGEAFDPETLKVLKMKQGNRQRSRERDREHAAPQPDGAAAPSPPFTPGTAPRGQTE